MPIDTNHQLMTQLLADAHSSQVVEEARREKLIGASLEARVLLWVESPVLQQAIQRTNDADNGVDPLRYLFITSQARPHLWHCP